MMRRFLKSSFASNIISFLAAFYIRIVYYTNRWQFLGQEILESYIQDNKPFIVCFWHGRLCMLSYAWLWKDRPFHMLLSTHSDGKLIEKTIAHFGISAISGSTQRGGTQALREMVATLRKGETIGITPDGPRGPAEVVSPGIITLAKLAGVDILPVTFSTSRCKRLKTWDRFFLALPFGRGVFICGKPILPPAASSAEEEKARVTLESALREIQREADRLVGVRS